MERNDPTNSLLEAPSFRVGSHQFTFGEPRDYYENYLDNEFERGHK